LEILRLQKRALLQPDNVVIIRTTAVQPPSRCLSADKANRQLQKARPTKACYRLIQAPPQVCAHFPYSTQKARFSSTLYARVDLPSR
jgi:hypothetical protein